MTDFVDKLPALLVWYVVFVFSTTLHEFGHAFAGLLGGDTTAYEGGQVSLDPTPHIKRSPMGMVVIPIISFLWMGWMIGFASAPYDPRWAERNPRKYALMSAAGPAANFLLVIVSFLAILVTVSMGVHQLSLNPSIDSIVVAASGDPRSASAMLAMGLSVMLVLNLMLGIFNLMPIPPLDGSGVLEGLWPQKVGGFFQALRGNPGFGILGLMVAWNVFPMLFGVPLRLVLGVLYAVVG